MKEQQRIYSADEVRSIAESDNTTYAIAISVVRRITNDLHKNARCQGLTQLEDPSINTEIYDNKVIFKIIKLLEELGYDVNLLEPGPGISVRA